MQSAFKIPRMPTIAAGDFGSKQAHAVSPPATALDEHPGQLVGDLFQPAVGHPLALQNHGSRLGPLLGLRGYPALKSFRSCDGLSQRLLKDQADVR